MLHMYFFFFQEIVNLNGRVLLFVELAKDLKPRRQHADKIQHHKLAALDWIVRGKVE